MQRGAPRRIELGSCATTVLGDRHPAHLSRRAAQHGAAGRVSASPTRRSIIRAARQAWRSRNGARGAGAGRARAASRSTISVPTGASSTQRALPDPGRRLLRIHRRRRPEGASARTNGRSGWPGMNGSASPACGAPTPAVGEAFTMLTCPPGPDIAPYHRGKWSCWGARQWAAWLDPRVPSGELCQPLPAGSLNAALV